MVVWWGLQYRPFPALLRRERGEMPVKSRKLRGYGGGFHSILLSHHCLKATESTPMTNITLRVWKGSHWAAMGVRVPRIRLKINTGYVEKNKFLADKFYEDGG